MILNAAGGDCLEDFGHLREDAGLSELIGYELPSPEAAWNFLHAFHEEQKIEEAQQRRLPGEMAYIPEESAPLAGLGRVNRELVQELGSRCADQQVATVDQVTGLARILKGRMLSDGRPLTFKESPQEVTIELPPQPPDMNASVIVLETA